MPAATVVRAFTNLRFGKVKFVYAVAYTAHHSRRPVRRRVTEVVTAHLKTALKCSARPLHVYLPFADQDKRRHLLCSMKKI